MKKLLAVCLIIPALVCAEILPSKGIADPRVRTVEYNPENVVRLSTFYGVSTHIQFSDGEEITDIGIGDKAAWQIVPRNNHLFIKPRALQANTNVTVVTSKRVYHFALVVNQRSIKDKTAWSDPNLIFSLSFAYPIEADAKAAQKRKDSDLKNRLASAPSATDNLDYWVKGSPAVSPTWARDNGRFIYLKFGNNGDMPAIYQVDGQGNEALVNTHVEGNEIVIQRMSERLMLRKGDDVAEIVNRSFSLSGGMDNTTGTASNDVRRTVKGAK